jgi:hypothetical protein
MGKEGDWMFDRGLVLEHMLQEDGISFNVVEVRIRSDMSF